MNELCDKILNSSKEFKDLIAINFGINALNKIISLALKNNSIMLIGAISYMWVCLSSNNCTSKISKKAYEEFNLIINEI